MTGIGAVRPTGEPLPLFPADSKEPVWLRGYQVAWVDSGTAALAIALRAIVKGCGASRTAVAVPAYGCPDIISAIIWAGCEPILVDTIPDSPWLDVAKLDAVHDRICAVIAPHFLGLPHPRDELEAWCAARRVACVEDCAQSSPLSGFFRPQSPYVVLSFGRGKPIPAGGGALLFQESVASLVASAMEGVVTAAGTRWTWRIRAIAHNMALTRAGYRLAAVVPGLRVGQTAYRSSVSVRRMSPRHAEFAAGVVEGWKDQADKTRSEVSRLVDDSECLNLATTLGWDGRQPLLRFPVLAPSAEAARRLMARPAAWKSGVSAFYGTTLDGVSGIPALEREGSLQHAHDFASRLLTLPVHSGVDTRDLLALRTLLSEMGNGRGSMEPGGQCARTSRTS